jgi:hypothetical protein
VGFLGREYLGRGFFFVQFFLVVQHGECTKSARNSPGFFRPGFFRSGLFKWGFL